MATDAYLPPGLDAVSVQSVAEKLRASRDALRRLSPAEVCRILGEVHDEWADPRSRLHRVALESLTDTTGYARPTLARHLRSLFGRMSKADLEEWLRTSAPEGKELFGPGVVGVIAAGNLPGTAIPSLVQALLLRSTCLVKSASAEPHLSALYAESIAARSPDLARAMAVLAWPREDDASTDALLGSADALIAYGSDATLAALRSRFPPGRPFVGYGHRISFSVIGRLALTRKKAAHLAGQAALDVAMFDQQGCLSPQAIYLQRGGEVSPSAFGELLAGRLERLRTLLPRRPLSAAESAGIHQFRGEFEMQALSRRGARIWQVEAGTGWTVALDPDPVLRPSPLNRTIRLHPFESPGDIAEAVSDRQGHLISCALFVSLREEMLLRSSLAALGVTRFCRLGSAQSPTSEEILLHDGVNALQVLGKERATQP